MALQTKQFTANGKSLSGVPYTYILDVTENSVDTANNRSSITVKAILKAESFTFNFTRDIGVSCTLNGKEIFKEIKSRSFSSPGSQVLYTWSGNVDHNSDGTLRLKVGGRLWKTDSERYTPPELTIKESDSNYMTLTAIARESTAGAADAYIGSNTTISVKRNSASYSHVIKVQFGGITGYIQNDWSLGDSSVKLTDTSISFKIPESFYEQIPESPSGVCKLTVTTYNGNTQVGSAKESTFKCLADPEKCSPTITGSVVDVNRDTKRVTVDDKTLVRFMSTARCTPDARAKYGARIVEKKVNGMAVTGEYLDIPNVENNTFVFSVTDSRGFTATATVTSDMIPYVKLTCEASCKRVSPTSDKAVLNVSGDWFDGNFGNLDNYITVFYTVSGPSGYDIDSQEIFDGTGKYNVSIGLDGLDYQEEYDVVVLVQDVVDGIGIGKSFTVHKGIPVFDWGEDSFRFNVPVYIGEKTLEQYIKDIMNGG